MVKIRRCPKLFAFVIGVVCMASTVIAEVVVNEAMINEPGGATNREWFELYVDSDQAVLMDGYRVLVGDATITFAPGYFLGPHEFLVICRKLVSTDGASFEGYWGDSSGVWGDTPDETAILTPIEATFSLVNKGGSIQLFHDGHLVSDVTWTGPGVDGVSLERISPQSNSVEPSVDWEGSTPGVINSVTPVGSDLALEDISATNDDGTTTLSFTLVNRGLEMFDETVLSLYYAADSSGTPGSLMDQFEIPSLSPGESFETNGEYVFDNMYVDLVATLPADDRLRNNTRIFTAPATEFPPFQLSELMPKPAAGAFGEWVEIINCLDCPYDLTGWCIGDYKEVELITDTGIMVAPGQWVVLARSASTFSERYPAFDGLLIEPTSWSP
ncbi:MAG: lamin tail domain-containing protein, partial [candidate division Zixibacteria bacterium]|nr:lamin tail domain-containing protein [candidate division Zixibacteria bacterium]